MKMARSGSTDDLAGLRVDESTLSPEEKVRLDYIQKISLEADAMIRQAGFKIDDDGEEPAIDERAIMDTKWSGQSEVEATASSQRNFNDLTGRPGLLFFDVIAIVAFAAIGRSSHSEGTSDIIALLTTAGPFLISWLLLSPLLGGFSREATKSKGSVLQGTLLPWAVSMPAALALRGFAKGAVPPTPFIIVTLISTFALLNASRYLYILLNGETSDGEFKQAGALEVFKMVGALMRRW